MRIASNFDFSFPSQMGHARTALLTLKAEDDCALPQDQRNCISTAGAAPTMICPPRCQKPLVVFMWQAISSRMKGQ